MNRDGLLVGLIRNALRDVGNQSDPNQVPQRSQFRVSIGSFVSYGMTAKSWASKFLFNEIHRCRH